MFRVLMRKVWNNKRICAAVGVVGTLLFLLFASSSLKGDHGLVEREKRDVSTANEKKYMQFDDFVTGKFEAKSLNPYWVSDSEYLYRKYDGSFAKVNIETGNEEEFLPASIWNSYPNQYTWDLSADQTYMAILFNRTEGYPHYTRTFSMAFIDTSSQTDVKFTDFPEEAIQTFKWDPLGHSLAFVVDFDLYIVVDPTVTPVRVTNDGVKDVIFNGIADSVISSLMSDSYANLWWSPNGKFIAFATVDDTDIEPFEFTYFGNQRYPRTVRFPYGKVGLAAPKTLMSIYDLDNSTTIRIEPHDHAQMMWPEYYLNSAVWRNDNIFTPMWKNRVQNESLTENCVAPNFTCSHYHAMMDSSSTGWLGHFNVPHVFPSNNDTEYFTVRSNNGFPHLARMDDGMMDVDWRTDGSFEVTDTDLGYQSIHNYDSTFDWIYFTSTEMVDNIGQGLPRIRHLWRTKGHGDDRTRTCITCELNTVYKDRCNWVTPSFSTNGSYLVVNCGGTANGVPLTTVHMKNATGDYRFVRVAENNTDLQNTLSEYHFRERVYGTIKLPDLEDDWYYTLHKPPMFDENKKYPLLVQVYSGPGWQNAEDSWTMDWARCYVASSDLDVIVMTFDGRGTGYRGDAIMHMVYRKLGQYEPLDQIEAARQVSAMFNYIDESRIAIWGRSYGGYATARTIGEDANQVFKCGFSVAPVVDWKLYYTGYTERYLGLPTGDNEEGYEKSSAVQKLENFGKHYFVLVHGTSDANVHFQNAALLSKELIAKDIDFSNYFAADESHSFRNLPNGYSHHYKLLTHHLKICFNIEN